MKTISNKTFLILAGLMFISNFIQAETSEIKNFIGNELSNFHLQGFYVIGGIVAASLIIYVLINHFNKEEDEKIQRPAANAIHHRRHHHHKVVKKTA